MTMIQRMMMGALALAALVCGVGVPLMALMRDARADPKSGLWQEAVTQADGVTVRVFRDTTGGNFNVCYVASNRTNNIPGSVAVAISCVPERKP